MPYKNYILVYSGTKGDVKTKKSQDLFNALSKELVNQNLDKEAQVVKTGFYGYFEEGPFVKILPGGAIYSNVDPKDAADIIREHIGKNKVVERIIWRRPSSEKNLYSENINIHGKQQRIVLRNCGIIDPESIDEYIARDGYAALEKALSEMSSEDIIEELKISGIRGRGGAGFPTWKKWLFTKNSDSEQKYVICNSDEGDPGAYMDRSTLEGDPHSILEAMALAGYTVGANKGVIYIRIEYPLAIKRLKHAIQQANDYGLLGKNILNTGFDFEIELRYGAGAFVCGEETALIASAEGGRGMPLPRPPFPAVKGLWGEPTVINNVETYANIPMIILKGGAWFGNIGTERSKGTKVFALTGKINNSGLVEVPMGTTLRDIVYKIGGGINDGNEFKAIQTGGPSGGLIPAKYLDTEIDYENLQSLGSIVGSGGMIVMDNSDCIIDVVKFYLNFSIDESCGKCAPCRIGARTLYNIIDKISKGKGSREDIPKIYRITHAMQKASLCGLGQTTPNPVLSALEHFREEVDAHIDKKCCPAGKCIDMIKYYILPDKCIGCTLCARHCPVNAIDGKRQGVHVIDQSKCIKCGECYKVCKFNAVTK